MRLIRMPYLLAIGLMAPWVMSLVFAQSALTPADAPRNSAQAAEELKDVGVKENLGGMIPLSLKFTDEHGKAVTLADYFQGQRPVLLTLAYYECPMLCTLVLNGVSDAVKPLNMSAGEDFQLLTVSINPREGADLALQKQRAYLQALNGKVKEKDWHFLVGDESQSKALAAALGFEYRYESESQQYAHPAVSFVITPDGKISRYLYGASYRSKDLRLALVEASAGKIGTTFDRILLYCYQYDPSARGYVLISMRLMRIGAGLAVLALLGFFIYWWRREKSDQQTVETPKSGSSHG